MMKNIWYDVTKNITILVVSSYIHTEPFLDLKEKLSVGLGIES